jgi:hypothetical protein
VNARPPVNRDSRTIALRILEARRRRTNHFPIAIFNEIAWEVLLSLYARQEAVDAAAFIRSAPEYPPSVTERWINYLVSEGLIARSSPPDDGQPALTLTNEGALRIEAWVSEFEQLIVD